MVNSLVIKQSDMIFIVTEDPALLEWKGSGTTFTVRRDTYEYVKAFVESKADLFGPMLQQFVPGQVLYWELDAHDFLTAHLANDQHSQRDVSHALCALGM